MGIALGVNNFRGNSIEEMDAANAKIYDTLAETKPTAVNLFWAIERMKAVYARAQQRR